MAGVKNDFNPEDYVDRVGELEKFKEEFSGKNFDKKVCESIAESTAIQEKIEGIIGKTFKNKIVWFILGGLGVIFADLILRAIPSILGFISAKP